MARRSRYTTLLGALLCLLLPACGKVAPAPAGKLVPVEYRDNPPPFSDWEKGDWGYVNMRNEYVLDPRFERAAPFHEGIAAVRIGGKWGWINPSGEYTIEPRYTFATDFDDEGMALVSETGAGGRELERLEVLAGQLNYVAAQFVDGTVIEGGAFIDRTGAYVVPPQYEALQPFRGGMAAFREGGKWGYLDRTGAAVIEPQFDRVRPFDTQGAYAPVQVGAKWGFINAQGEVVVDAGYSDARIFGENPHVGQVSTGTGQGLVQMDGTLLTDLAFDSFSSFSTADWALVSINCCADMSGYPSLLIGEQIIQTPAPGLGSPSAPRTRAYAVISLEEGQRPGLYAGFANDMGELVAFPMYFEGLSAACLDRPLPSSPESLPDKFGYIDTTGHLVIPARFDTAGPFKNGIATVILDGQRVRIDREGNALGPAEEQAGTVSRPPETGTAQPQRNE